MIYYVEFLEIRLNVLKVMKTRMYETSNGLRPLGYCAPLGDVYVYSFVRYC